MAEINVVTMQTPLGPMTAEAVGGSLCRLGFTDGISPRTEGALSPLLTYTVEWVRSYFAGSAPEWTRPLAPSGTPFQRKVWDALRRVPYGRTTSYLSLSRELGDELAIRAVAAANGKNPIAIIIPCHRVIGSDGSLTGYAGGLHRKKALLELELGVSSPDLWGNR